MKAFFDSSAFAKRYIEEPGSPEADRLCLAAERLGLSVICPPEIVSALNRRVREKRMTAAQYRAARERLLEDMEDAEVISLTPEVIAQATLLLEASPLRAMDALHLACAAVWGAEVFVSADKAQTACAARLKMTARLV